MKTLLLISTILLSITSGFALDLEVDPLKRLEAQSEFFLNSSESCSEVISNHVTLVEGSEHFISSLTGKKSIEITSYEITMLQKILTNRFLHLTKAVNMHEEENQTNETMCSPKLMGKALAVYDFNQLGQKALKDAKLRRIILNFTNLPKYKLTKLKELYDHYTSAETIQDLLVQINEEKISLPESLMMTAENGKLAKLTNLSDVAIKGSNNVVSGATRVWGFISDQLKWRNGRLHKNDEAKKIVSENLKPLDLIYETRNFTLSNYTIPGHWGHVAVWLGTKEELIELGVWDQEFFAPFRRHVEQGNNIIEVRKKGVNAVSLENFMNLDEVAITRVAGAREKAESIFKELTEQIDKKYDFTFNAHSTDKLTCSEFIAFSYGNIHWPETKALFQISIKPDDLAILTLYKNSPTDFVLYLKGDKKGSFENKNFDDWRALFGKRAESELQYQ